LYLNNKASAEITRKSQYKIKQGLAANCHTVVHLPGKAAEQCYSSYSKNLSFIYIPKAIYINQSNLGMIFSYAAKQMR
jgi:hypothetical protein